LPRPRLNPLCFISTIYLTGQAPVKCASLHIFDVFNRARHGEKRHVMVPARHVMANNDRPWKSLSTGLRSQASLPCYRATANSTLKILLTAPNIQGGENLGGCPAKYFRGSETPCLALISPPSSESPIKFSHRILYSAIIFRSRLKNASNAQ
jgi:hypothetical protein